MLSSFTHDHDGERLSCVSGGGGGGGGDGHGAPATVVLLHGAGNGSKERLVPLLEEFVARGCRGLAFDFSGHGESSGELRELSLRGRFEQAVAVIDAQVPADGPLILVGFSMSGQTVADLAGHYGQRVVALGLCAPAVYGAAAWPVPFGEGDSRFSEIIRTPDGWRDAPALDVLRGVRRPCGARRTRHRRRDPARRHRGRDGRAHHPRPVHPARTPGRRPHGGRCGSAITPTTGSGSWTPCWWGWTTGDGPRPGRWVAKQLPDGGGSVRESVALRGGWSSQMRRLAVEDGTGLVLRSFVKPFFRRHAPGLLAREASVLTLLAPYQDVPAPELYAVDADAEHCDHPSLLMSLLPGSVRVDEVDVERRVDLLARQLVRIHAVVPEDRPRVYQPWTSPERVRTPAGALWDRAVDVIRREPPAYEGCFLHRDFHPGNVLFSGADDTLRISGVVDWVETSWGPADLDVAHCSTALALLHGEAYGLGFRERYEAHGGRRPADDESHLYWRLLDALAYSPDAEKLAVPWRELGRADLTPDVLGERLTAYVAGLLELYG